MSSRRRSSGGWSTITSRSSGTATLGSPDQSLASSGARSTSASGPRTSVSPSASPTSEPRCTGRCTWSRSASARSSSSASGPRRRTTRRRSRSRSCAGRSPRCSTAPVRPSIAHRQEPHVDPRDLSERRAVPDRRGQAYDAAMGILSLQERRRVRLFVRRTTSAVSSRASSTCLRDRSPPSCPPDRSILLDELRRVTVESTGRVSRVGARPPARDRHPARGMQATVTPDVVLAENIRAIETRLAATTRSSTTTSPTACSRSTARSRR